MATAKKTTPAAKTSSAGNAPAKRASAAKKSLKSATSAKKTSATAAPATKTAKAPAATNGTGAAIKPIKSAFTKPSLIAHLAESAGVEPKAVRAVLASLEATVLASVHKRGLGSFTLPGLLKVDVIQVPAKKKRIGIDPFTKEERVYAARPASVRVKARALKKLKDAAL